MTGNRKISLIFLSINICVSMLYILIFFFRYRIIVFVTIGEKKMQGIRTYHSFLWDHERDNFAQHTFETNNYYVQCLVYGVYLD